MNICKPLIAVLLLVGCGHGAVHQAAPQQQQLVSLRSSSVVRLKAEGEAVASLSFQIRPGYYIMPQEVEDDNLIASQLHVEADPAFRSAPARFPPAVAKQVSWSSEPLMILTDTFSAIVSLSLQKAMPAGRYLLEGRLYYQACDAVKCYFPRELSFPLTVIVD